MRAKRSRRVRPGSLPLPPLARREVLRALGLGPAAISLGCSTAGGAAGAANPDAGDAAGLPPTPACPEGGPTPPQIEGPYFTPQSPERPSLVEAGLAGRRLVFEGQVLSRACAPVARALVDLWQADDAGAYDNTGFRLRGHQFADAGGRFRFETIVPGFYPGRTRHLHLKVQAPGGPVLTTQLYFPGEAANARDGYFVPELLLAVTAAGPDQQTGRFTFVI